jgi:hypothetical protein
MAKKIFLTLLFFSLLFINYCFPQQQAKDSIARTKKLQYGLFFSMELLPKLKNVYNQKRSIGYGPGISLTYNFPKKWAINFNTEILNSNLDFEKKRENIDTLNHITVVIEKRNCDFLIMRSNLSFEYYLLRRNFKYYLKFGIENVSTSQKMYSIRVVTLNDSLLYADTYSNNSVIKDLFMFFDNENYRSFLGFSLSPGICLLPLKQIKLYSELDIKYNDKLLLLGVYNKRISFGIKIGIDL